MRMLSNKSALVAAFFLPISPILISLTDTIKGGSGISVYFLLRFIASYDHWKGGRVVECTGLEIRHTVMPYRGFESLPFRQINPSRQRSLGFFFGCLRTDPFLAEARGNESVFLFSEEQNGCTKSDSHAGAAGKPGAADDSERRNVGEPRNDNDDTGNRGQRAKEFA